MPKVFIHNAFNSPFAFQLGAMVFLLCLLLGFRPPVSPPGLSFSQFSPIYSDFRLAEPGFLENSIGVNTAGLREVLVEGGSGNSIGRKRSTTIEYTIKPGDTVWKIAHKLKLQPSTILWANNLTALSKLSVGKTIRIPPTDGVYYQVQSQDTLGEIARAHRIDIAKINGYNSIQNNLIKAGQELFIPGASRVYIAAKPTSSRPNSTSPPMSLPSTGITFLRPTQGTLTQGYHRKHYAIDIANKLNTPIYASAAGTVKISKTGGWNYGYGNYIVIDHGNGVETLYSHNNVNKVQVGNQVRAGQLIALMGNTGRVFGVTGIHLHFEIRIRGRKVNPYNYF